MQIPSIVYGLTQFLSCPLKRLKFLNMVELTYFHFGGVIYVHFERHSSFN